MTTTNFKQTRPNAALLKMNEEKRKIEIDWFRKSSAKDPEQNREKNENSIDYSPFGR